MTGVLITGIGAVVAGASGVAEFWANIRDGHSRISRVDRLVAANAPTWIGGEITGFDPLTVLPPAAHRFAVRHGRETLVPMASITQAMLDAGLAAEDVASDRMAIIGASSRGPLTWWRDTLVGVDRSGSRSAILQSMPGTPALLAAMVHGVRGLVTTISNGCVSGHQAIGLAVDMLRAEDVDAAVVAGHDFPLVPELLRVYGLMGDGALCRRREAGTARTAMRPYDRTRDGFVLGEAAVALCLERASSVRRRGGRGYAELLGHRSRSDAAHPMAPDTTGKRGSELVEEVLAACGRTPDDVGYICGHGSATKYNDLAEGRMVDRLYPHRAQRRPPLGSVKPVYGHGLGASGTLNVAAVALMLHHQCLAPTLNCADPDPDCGGDHVLDGPRHTRLDLGLSLSAGLGSQSSVVALGAHR